MEEIVYSLWKHRVAKGDTVMTTNNPYILKGIKLTKALVCLQKNTDKILPTESDFIKANKNSFGDDIGSVTNRVTSMYSVLARYEVGSPEWIELDYRIKCGQNYQQNAIDKAKGIISKPMPKEWYMYAPNKILDTDTEEVAKHKQFNIDIMADKKPYFFNYVYPSLMKKYTDYLKVEEVRCLRLFKKSVEELKCKPFKSEEEKQFLYYHNLRLPSDVSPCIMNKITWIIENEFGNYSKRYTEDEKFDYTILKSEDVKYSPTTYKKMEALYKKYIAQVKSFEQSRDKIKLTRDEKQQARENFKQYFIDEATNICSNEDELCNIVLDLCYRKTSSKQFAWDICGKTIIRNLLKRTGGKFQYPALDEEGTIEFKGLKFSMKEQVVEVRV